MKKMFDRLAGAIYDNKRTVLRYLIAALVCTLLRYVLGALLNAAGAKEGSGELIAWIVWSLMFYPILKLWVFSKHMPDIYSLLKNISIYAIMCGVLYWTRTLFVTAVYVLSSNTAAALAVGGTLNELLCAALAARLFVGKTKK